MDPRRQFERALVWAVLMRLISRGEQFTTDDWWREALLGEIPTEHRCIGAAIQKAKKLGLIAPTGEFVQTQRPQAHGRSIQVWRVLRSTQASVAA